MVKSKKIVSMLLVTIMFFSIGCVSAFAKDNNSNIVEITEKYISENGVKTTDELGNAVIEIPIDINSHIEDVQNSDGTNVEPEHFSLFPHTHYIENISKYKVNDFIPVTDWSTQGEVTYSVGSSFSISSSITTSVGVSAEVVSSNIGSSVTGQSTITATQSYKYDIPSGYKGRVIYRYSYDAYSFDCVTKWTLTGSIDRGSGSAKSKPYNDASAYFTLQLISAY